MPRLMDTDFLADMLSGRVSMNAASIINRLVFTKSAEWAHEREWRIFAGTGRNPRAPYEDIHFHLLELDAAIFGYLMSEEDRKSFTALTRSHYPHAQILRVDKSERQFRLEIKPLEA
jgi:hypothetical protein